MNVIEELDKIAESVNNIKEELEPKEMGIDDFLVSEGFEIVNKWDTYYRKGIKAKRENLTVRVIAHNPKTYNGPTIDVEWQFGYLEVLSLIYKGAYNEYKLTKIFLERFAEDTKKAIMISDLLDSIPRDNASVYTKRAINWPDGE